MSGLSDRERTIRQRLKGDFPHYAGKCLKIRPKDGGLVPLVLNDVQRIIHAKLEEQRDRTGRVRALILKARQPGCSTLVEGRFYWKTSHNRGRKAFILTHKQDATDNLFSMAQRFHDNCPGLVKPQTGKSNSKELFFRMLDSGYRVGTAGTKGVGRSDTIQYFHGSEVAFWEKASDHMTGALQAVPDADDTEIILESTANGLGGLFYSMCKAAERGDSEYILIFIPWFSHKPYREAALDGWVAPDAFAEYGELYDLLPNQIYWAWRTNRGFVHSLDGDADSGSDEICWKFRQEYPANAEEAFQTGDAKSFIKSENVMRARKVAIVPDDDLPLIIGVDVARGGADRTRIMSRRGRRMGGEVNKTIDSDDTMYIANFIAAEVIERFQPTLVNVDVTGVGAGVYDRLKEMKHKQVRAVNFGSRATREDVYVNKRAEMWGEMRDWLADPAGADIPDEDALHTEMCAPVWGAGATRYDAKSRIIIEPKENIIKRIGSSPDGGDAGALTFAFHVALPRPPPDRYGGKSRHASVWAA